MAGADPQRRLLPPVYKRYFTGEQLAQELEGEMLFEGTWFVAARTSDQRGHRDALEALGGYRHHRSAAVVVKDPYRFMNSEFRASAARGGLR